MIMELMKNELKCLQTDICKNRQCQELFPVYYVAHTPVFRNILALLTCL